MKAPGAHVKNYTAICPGAGRRYRLPYPVAIPASKDNVPAYRVGYLLRATESGDGLLLHFPLYGDIWVDSEAAVCLDPAVTGYGQTDEPDPFAAPEAPPSPHYEQGALDL